MRTACMALIAVATAFVASGPAAAEGCSAYRATCEAVCTPQRVSRYYFGSIKRCTASCEPRWQQCLRTGAWADLEYRYSGWWERATGF